MKIHNNAMGISGLTKTLKRIAPGSIKEMSYEDLAKISSKGVYGVDVFSYLYPTQYNKAKKAKGNHIRDFMEMIATYASIGFRLIFVFDGNTYSEAKKDTMDVRIEKRLQGQANIQTLVSNIIKGEPELELPTDSNGIVVIDSDLHKIGHQILSSSKGTAEQRIELEYALKSHIIVSGDKVDDLVTLFQLVGATYMKAQGEADFLLSSLYKFGHIDGVISEDSDMLTHGIERLVRGGTDATLRRLGRVTVYSLSTILDEAKLSTSQFIDLCILCGCDYCPKIKGIASVTGLTLLRKHSNITNIVNGIEDGTIKFKPNGVTLEEYVKRYERAFCIFNREQEELPQFRVSSYTFSDGFREWILAETNYTLGTLEKKIEIIEAQSWATPAPVPKVQTMIPAVSPAMKITVRRKPDQVPKIKIKAKLNTTQRRDMKPFSTEVRSEIERI
jgi:5'-3' exonuclease